MSARPSGGPALLQVAPSSFTEIAETLASADADGRAVAIHGAQTKPWGPVPRSGDTETDPDTDARPPTPAPAGDREALHLFTTGLTEITAFDPGDMTASLQAGVSLADAQARFAAAGQMLALDPPQGAGDAATIGGIVATADRGPLAHRYGGPRDLVVGATVALADGTVARSGGTVIKNVAGYDIAKLLCGSFGTLGVILSVNVRLHPRHPTVTAIGSAAEPRTLAAAAHALAALPAELEALDVSWEPSGGAVLARCAGPQAHRRAERITQRMRDAGLQTVEIDDADDARWAAQRARQRSDHAAVLHVAGPPAALADVLTAVRLSGASVVARAGLGEAHVTLDPQQISSLRAHLPPTAVSVLRDCPPAERARVADPWDATAPAALALMRAVKARFDPHATCNPHTFVGGI